MRLLDLTATAHPFGLEIDLRWTFPPDQADQPPAVQVVRRTDTHPAGPGDGVVVADGPGLTQASDTGLRAETVYYYALFPHTGSTPVFDVDPGNRVSAMATGRYGFAERLYQLLPGIYRRYDAVAPPVPSGGAGGDPADSASPAGPLRRFLDLPGSQLDALYSLIRAELSLHDLSRVDGTLLPLLAQWIGWRTDFGRSIAGQRSEIRYAPDIYRTVGAIGSVEATVARITDWTPRVKEYVHNVARTNLPARLNLWAMERGGDGTFSAAGLVSLNALYEGRAAHVRDDTGGDLFAYHTARSHGWDIWAKTRDPEGVWQPSVPLVDRPGVDKNPAMVLRHGVLWLFWENYVEDGPAGQRHWRVLHRTRSADGWSPISVLGDDTGMRRNPAAVLDEEGRLWLFWREWTGTAWQIRFNIYDGTSWQLDPAGTVPTGASPVGPQDALIAVFHPQRTGQRLWLFWVGQQPGGPAGQTRSAIAWLIKTGTDPAAADWSAVQIVPKASAADHDADPCPLSVPAGVELFWASTRSGGWSLVHAVRDEDAQTWGEASVLAGGPVTCRWPMAVATAAGTTLLTFRSDASLAYAHATPSAPATVAASADLHSVRTLDARYAGTTTVRVLDSARRALAGTFQDVQSYTYQTGTGGVRTDQELIGRDTVGLFLQPPAQAAPPAPPDQPDLDRLRGVLPEVMPVTNRTVLIVQP